MAGGVTILTGIIFVVGAEDAAGGVGCTDDAAATGGDGCRGRMIDGMRVIGEMADNNDPLYIDFTLDHRILSSVFFCNGPISVPKTK